MAMNPEIKAKWAEALRSGKYKQGKIGLYNQETDGYCCLGVLCEVMAIPHGPVSGSGYLYYKFPDDLTSIELSPNTRQEIGLSFSEEGKLISMNDGQGKTFPEIATYIEENL